MSASHAHHHPPATVRLLWLAMGLTLGMALGLTRRRPGAYATSEGLARAGAFA